MTRLGTVLRRQLRPIRDTDRFSLTPAGMAALDSDTCGHDPEDSKAAKTALRGSQESTEAYLTDTLKDTEHANH